MSDAEVAGAPRPFKWLRVGDITTAFAVIAMAVQFFTARSVESHRLNELEKQVMDLKLHGSDEVRGLREQVRYVVERVGSMEAKLDRTLYQNRVHQGGTQP